jgi:hypothetical protein
MIELLLEVPAPSLLRELTLGADVRLAADAMRQLSMLPWPVMWHSCGEFLRKPLGDNVQTLSVRTNCRPSADPLRSGNSPTWRRLRETP